MNNDEIYTIDNNIDDCVFEDFFNVNEIQKLQNKVADALQIGTIITYPDGTPITAPSNFCDFCYKVIRKSELGLKNCIKSDATFGKPNKDGPMISQCLSGGLLDGGVSIMVGDKHIANWLFGQVRDETIQFDDEINRRKAIELKIDPDIYCREIKKVPFLTRERFTEIANLIHLIANQLSEIAYKNYIQRLEIEYRKELEQKLKEEHQKLIEMNTYDALTGLYSRRYFNAMVDNFEEQKVAPIAVIMGDVNNLKVVNDIFGHTYGDKLLTTAGDILKAASKEHYIIGRCGGDEFNILIPGGTESEAIEFCQKVQDACHTQKISEFRPSIALGYSIRTSDVQTLTAAMDFAETKMYSDKALIKQRQNLLNDIEKIICKKGFMTPETIKLNMDIARSFAEYLELGKIDADNLTMLSRIVDFGIVAYSDYEFHYIDNTDIMCNHIEIGYRIAKLTDKTYHLADAVYQSHEWWNGLGTPMHKKGNEINLYARIISIITYYTQTISPAPYGFGKTPTSALKLIKKYSGKRFDPEYAEKFIAFAEEHLLEKNTD